MHDMALKRPWYFSLLMEKPLGCYSQVRSPYYQAAHRNQKTPIPVSSRGDRSGLRKPKRISINTNDSYHQRSSPKASLNWSNNNRLSFKQPNRKRLGARLVDTKKNIYLIRYFYCDIITRRLPNQG